MSGRPLWKVRIEHRDTEPFESVRTEADVVHALAGATHDFNMRTNANLLRIRSVEIKATSERPEIEGHPA